MLTWLPDTDALAGAFAENVEAGLRDEGDEDDVEASKRCNQFVHYCNKGTIQTKKTLLRGDKFTPTLRYCLMCAWRLPCRHGIDKTF